MTIILKKCQAGSDTLYDEVQDQWNGLDFFFLKSHILGPDDRNLPIFFPSVVYPLYLHVIIDFGHIWGPFMAEIEKMCQKSAFLVVPDFGYPQVVCAFVSKWWT